MDNEVPTWSGEFFQFEDGIGVISVHAADKSHPKPPEGWVFESAFVDVDNDCQSFIYQKAA